MKARLIVPLAAVSAVIGLGGALALTGDAAYLFWPAASPADSALPAPQTAGNADM